jgi:hypothetical protein
VLPAETQPAATQLAGTYGGAVELEAHGGAVFCVEFGPGEAQLAALAPS